MSRFPSLPLFTDAYIADTTHLTNEEHGAYLRLLMFAWRSPDCRLPDDDARLARMLGLTAKKWDAIKPAVMAFWTLEDGYFSQKRLAREHQFVSEKVEKKRSAGSKGGRPKDLKNNDPCKASGSENRKQTESKPKAPTPTPIEPPLPPSGEPEGFLEFRAIYPKRNAAFPTTLARKRWREARRRGTSADEIIAGARAYAAEQSRIGKVGTCYVKTADVWLNQERWKDYTVSAAEPAPEPPTVTDETWRDRVRTWRARGGHWPWRPVEPPDDPRTTVPRYILVEFGITRDRESHPPSVAASAA